MSGPITTRMAELGIELPEPAAPAANYIPFVVTGNLIFVSGQVTVWNGELRHVGRLGENIDIDEGYQAARLCGLNLIAQAKAAALGDLNKIKRVIKLGGFVNSTPDFTDQPKVINGASDLMAEVFGEPGKHARFAVGAPTLPLGVAVEVDGVFELG
ncbi:MAG TPA: RidA family protein [Rhodospirillales bacterium]|jgi:enamine deaminase RidA (YjgF/YER057c/UK114 family)|nr:RidA family protein [Rhodospirillales bacterium]